jgi:uncharacterized glyoxalase superfamily protein PhnB
MSDKAIPERYNTVTPYLTARRAAEMVDFVKAAFGAEEMLRVPMPAGGLHAEVRLGDSMLMMGGGETLTQTPMPTALHLYVPDADAAYQRALDLGATKTYEPTDQPYGDHEAGVKDPFGNQWYIATHLGNSFLPEGLRTMMAYLHPNDAPGLIQFLKQAFGGQEEARYADPGGAIAHARLRIGDSVVEMSEARGEYQPMPTMFYLRVDHCDAVYQRALQAGAKSIETPADQPYGDRRAAVEDGWGNLWYMATPIKKEGS